MLPLLNGALFIPHNPSTAKEIEAGFSRFTLSPLNINALTPTLLAILLNNNATYWIDCLQRAAKKGVIYGILVLTPIFAYDVEADTLSTGGIPVSDSADIYFSA